MEIRAVGKRCGVVLSDLRLSLTDAQALDLLTAAGFRVVTVSLIELARSRIGLSAFTRKTQVREAPGKVDCSSFVKWLYAQLGVWVPRRTIQQWTFGQTVGLSEVVAGDLVFTKGGRTFYTDDAGIEIGHVGVVSGERTVIQAANSERGVVEDPLDKFCTQPNFKGARRIVPLGRLVTLEVPDFRDVESSDDVRWIILSSQTRK